MADNQDQGYVPMAPPSQRQQVAPPQTQPQTGATDQGYVPMVQQQTGGGGQTTPQPTQSWGINLQRGPNWGDITVPQSVQDWGDVAGNEAIMGTLPGLRAQADAARQRLGPAGAATADVAGNVLSPTTFLNALPGGAPIAGALHEGIKSYAAGNDWKTIADDTAMGGIAGFGGAAAAKAAPYVLPQLSRAVVDLGPAAGMTVAAHKLFGDDYREILGALGGYALMRNASEGAGEAAKRIANSPATQQAIKNLVLGGSSAFRQEAGPWGQWVQGP